MSSFINPHMAALIGFVLSCCLACVGAGVYLVKHGLTDIDVATGFVLAVVPSGTFAGIFAVRYFIHRPDTPPTVEQLRGGSSTTGGVMATLVYGAQAA